MTRALRWGLFWIPLVAVTYLALTPSPPESVTNISDVVLHASAFYLLTGALALAHFELRAHPTWILMLAYGAGLEAVQALTGRSPELNDLLVDGVGICAAVATLVWLPERVRIWSLGRGTRADLSEHE